MLLIIISKEKVNLFIRNLCIIVGSVFVNKQQTVLVHAYSAFYINYPVLGIIVFYNNSKKKCKNIEIFNKILGFYKIQ